MHFAIFVGCLVASILANRACSLRLSNIFIATSIFAYIFYQILLLVELLLMIYCKAVPGATIYKITRFYLNIDHWSIKLYVTITPIFTFGRASVSEIQ